MARVMEKVEAGAGELGDITEVGVRRRGFVAEKNI